MIEFIKHDCMWSGNCDRKCQGKMESLLSKSSFSNDNLNELYFNLCGNQDSIDLLDSLDSEDFSDLLINNFSTNQLNMNCQQQQYNNYYQCQPNYNNQPQTHQLKPLSTNLTININQIQQTTNHSNQNLSSNSSNLTKFDTTTTHQKQFDTSSLLGSSLNNELLLNSDSANIILTQHNQQVENSQLINNSTTSNQLNYNQTSLNTNLNNLNNQDLVNCTNDNSTLDNSINTTNVHLTNTHNNNNQIATIDNTNFNQHYHQILSNSNNMVSNYTFDNNLIDSTFSCTNVNDSAGSSNNSECSSSVLLERTDYDTDDIEDDLDLLEDIIEEECDDSNINCYSIANSLESSSDVEMIASPISDSLINDHSYGASSIDLLTTNHHQTIPLTTNTTITNVNQHHHSNYQSLINIQNQTTTTRSLIRNNHHNSTSNTKLSKRRQLANLNTNNTNNQITTRKNLHRHSGTSLLMKDKQSAASKIKKVMDTDRRKEHNESERMRRDVLKNAFLNLRNKCPKLQNSTKKSSRIQILNEATNFIKFMNKEQKNLEIERQQETKRKLELLAKLSKLENQ